jgi:hypothetical protein
VRHTFLILVYVGGRLQHFVYIEQQFFTTSVGANKAGGSCRFLDNSSGATTGASTGVGTGAGDSGASALGSGGGENGVLNRIGFALLERISRAIVEGEVRPAALNNSLGGCAARDDFTHFFLSR